ncbi:MAG: hypothetical protein V7641_3770 [Blastocatellia bacterium]
MAHKDNLDTSFIKNPDVAHEESDVNIRPIAWFMVWLTVATAVVMLLMIGLYRYLDSQANKQDERERSPLAGEYNPIPPKPLLQLAPESPGLTKYDAAKVTPTSEVELMRSQENLKLDHYDWVDQSKGLVGLPIERAKELALERGILKSRPQLAAAAGAQPAAPQNPESGRLQQDASGRQQGDEKH